MSTDALNRWSAEVTLPKCSVLLIFVLSVIVSLFSAYRIISGEPADNYIYAMLAAFYTGYACALIALINNLDAGRFSLSANKIMAVLSFAGTWIVAAGYFAICWLLSHAYSLSSTPHCCIAGDSILDSFYMSTTVLSTVGFGDYVPCGTLGKVIAMAEELIGVVHVGAFLTILFSQLTSVRLNGTGD